MRNGPVLVIFGTILGCMIVGAFSWALAQQFKVLPTPQVALAAAPATSNEVTGGEQKCEVSHKYPEGILQWCEMITSIASQVDLPPNLIAAIMLQESGGDPSAYSSSGAVGLMQVMPRDGIAATFECINGPCFASRPTIDELLDPRYNIEYGTHMLAGLINRLGSQREALKAYGPMDMEYGYADKVLAIYERYRQDSNP